MKITKPRWAFLLALFLLSGSLVFADTAVMSPSKRAIERLKKGNSRHIKDRLVKRVRHPEKLEAMRTKQTPFAVILGCSDSRVAPEIIFDQGLGNLFVVRVAGNVAGPIELESIEYAVTQLGAVVILVLGHENCGAMKAVLANQTADIDQIANLIEKHLESEPQQSGNRLENAIKNNVRAIVRELEQHPVLSEFLTQERIEIVGGYYHLSNGEVEFLHVE